MQDTDKFMMKIIIIIQQKKGKQEKQSKTNRF